MLQDSRSHDADPWLPPRSAPGDMITTSENNHDANKRQDFSHEHSEKTKLGEYTLGQTLGEGEFGKVKIGWKKTGGVQVAVKIIRRDKLDTPGRLAKVRREVAILSKLDHPNIVRLHEMTESPSTIGIILEYASGGELFDYILHQRYLKDDSARRLFAQLVSGVGYLHRKGIVHRDLKLENLLLDRNRNIIITDFGFANTFDPHDVLPHEIEAHLSDRRYCEKHGLDKPSTKTGFKRGDLMSTSCGSPCYAAPELVVSDGLYTGKKVDVWSCGVILYAMLAGYLPFDDDPANPEGDNINLLYKYIVTTPLVFPDYVTPHARDLLRQILIPDPIKRADLFSIARHSWLVPFAHVVEAITSDVPLPEEEMNIQPIQVEERTPIGRSASVREATNKSHHTASPASVLSSKQGRNHLDNNDGNKTRSPRDAKRRTVQVEYVAPHTQTVRGAEPIQNQMRVSENRYSDSRPPPPPAKDYEPSASKARSSRSAVRATSDSTAFTSGQTGHGQRPSTGGSLGANRLPPSRGSYGQPSAATVAPTTAEGRFSQPRPGASKPYIYSPVLHSTSFTGVPAMGGPRVDSPHLTPSASPGQPFRAHKRSHTLSGLGERILGRSGSVAKRGGERLQKPDRSHPPSSMRPIESQDSPPRKSVESRRSFGFHRKPSDLGSGEKRASRRFSLLPSKKTEPQQQVQQADRWNQQRAEMSSQSQNVNRMSWSQMDVDAQASSANQYASEKNGITGKNRRFVNEYDNQQGGSSGAARRVMEFFRRRR